MDVREYILDIYMPRVIVPRLNLEDEIFLSYISSGMTSAYKIYSHLKSSGSYRPAYKNVHKRIQRLLKYGYIEQVQKEGGFLHGAKNYRLKTRGITHIVSELFEPRTTELANFIRSHHANPIIKTFVDPILEMRTINNATYTLAKLLTNYIIDCCEITRFCFERLSPYEGDQPSTKLELFDNPPMGYMYYKLNWSIKSFILRCAILNEKCEDWDSYVINRGWRTHPLPSEGKIQCLANDKKQTQSLLAADKKFITKLREIEDDFKKGFNAMMGNQDSYEKSH